MYKANKFLITIILISLFAIKVNAQQKNNYDFERIEDNSYLIEEAYNQEPGVIQHISTFQLMKDKSWMYSFTEEIPVPAQKHQISFTLPIQSSLKNGLGDIAVNYRYQAIFTERFAFSPRISLLLPTGNYKNDLGSGVLGYQMNFPFSYLLNHKFVTHINIGTTFIPDAKKADNTTYNFSNINYGASIIWLLKSDFNIMLEAVGNTSYTKTANSAAVVSNSFVINPGLRYAFNFNSGLQIVPGIAFPIEIGSADNFGVFTYLSFEHPLWKP